MMLREINQTVGGMLDSTDPRVGVMASEIPVGFPNPPFLLNDIDGGFPNRLYSMEILTLPVTGTLYLDKTGAGSFANAPAGIYTGTQRVRKYDIDVGLVSEIEMPYTITISEPVTSVVSGVNISPNTATGSAAFTATVLGTHTPSQGVTWSATSGNITDDGVFTAPTQTGMVQTIVVTATSTQDITKSGSATVIIPAIPDLPARVISLQLRDKQGNAVGGLTNLKWAWFDQPDPSQFTAPSEQGAVPSLGVGGVLTIQLTNTALTSGDTGWLVITDSNGNSANIHKAFSGPVTIQ